MAAFAAQSRVLPCLLADDAAGGRLRQRCDRRAEQPVEAAQPAKSVCLPSAVLHCRPTRRGNAFRPAGAPIANKWGPVLPSGARNVPVKAVSACLHYCAGPEGWQAHGATFRMQASAVRLRPRAKALRGYPRAPGLWGTDCGRLTPHSHTLPESGKDKATTRLPKEKQDVFWQAHWAQPLWRRTLAVAGKGPRRSRRPCSLSDTVPARLAGGLPFVVNTAR